MTTLAIDMRESLWRSSVAKADAETGVFTGRAVAYDTPVDRGKDWDGYTIREGVRPKAAAAQLADPARVKILWQHDPDDPIGHVTGFADAPAALDFEALLDIDPMVPSAQRARLQIQSGTLTDLSIGFRWDKWVEEVDEDAMTRTIWHERIQLIEVSVVTWGAQGAKARAKSVQNANGSLLTLQARRARATLARQALAGLRA